MKETPIPKWEDLTPEERAEVVRIYESMPRVSFPESAYEPSETFGRRTTPPLPARKK